jgi:hypothetical protein
MSREKCWVEGGRNPAFCLHLSLKSPTKVGMLVRTKPQVPRSEQEGPTGMDHADQWIGWRSPDKTGLIWMNMVIMSNRALFGKPVRHWLSWSRQKLCIPILARGPSWNCAKLSKGYLLLHPVDSLFASSLSASLSGSWLWKPCLWIALLSWECNLTKISCCEKVGVYKSRTQC